MQRVDVAGGGRIVREFQHVVGHVVRVDAVAPDQFVQRRQGGGQLRAGHDLGFVERHERMRAARIRAVVEAQVLGHAVGVAVHLPAGGAVHPRRLAEDLGEALAGPVHLGARPFLVGLADAVLPAHVIPGVHAHLEAGIAHRPHHVRAALADIGAGQQCAVHQGQEAVVRQHRGALHLAREALAEHALDGAPGVVGAQAEQEGRPGTVAAQGVEQARHAVAGAAIGVDVHFEGELHG